MEKKTEMRKHFLHCNIAGFTYCDGCIVFGELTIGSELKLVREAENKHDPEPQVFVNVYLKRNQK